MGNSHSHRKKKAKKNAAGRSVAYDGGENGGVALKSDDAAVSLNRGNSSGNQSQNQSGNNHSNHDSNQHKQHVSRRGLDLESTL